ncbi:flagellar hook-length control protein FliK [Clostridium amylolyticum]|uniref:Flagellar hook-length control protein FliK n=1 Tax=Clostridium amylolyticum TaxID=1121298 RepID=A0A1M6CF52_9CLOT|nr:flagellar hook-length control protein FliK [Clostridium amylolyticum]SHI59660.1 flagellar hook-length control protein FliK [Clostridium amylolyticum]
MRQINTLKGALLNDLSSLNRPSSIENSKPSAIENNKEVTGKEPLEDKKFSKILTSVYKKNTKENENLSKNDIKDSLDENKSITDDKDVSDKLLHLILELLNINGTDIKDDLNKTQDLNTHSDVKTLESLIMVLDKGESLNKEVNIEVNKEANIEGQIKELVSLLNTHPKNYESIKHLLTQLKPEVLESFNNKLLSMIDKNSSASELYNIITSMPKITPDKNAEIKINTNENKKDEKNITLENTFSFKVEKKPVKDTLEVKPEGKGSLNEDKAHPSKEIKFLEEIINQKDKTIKETKLDNVINRMNISSNNIKELENLEINGETAVKDVVKVIKYMDKTNIKELTIKINPKELGSITIRLTMEAGAMKAHLTPTNKDTYNLLNKNLSELKSLMADSNIKVQDVSINIYNDDTTYFSRNFSESSFSESNKEGSSNGSNKNNTLVEEDIEETSTDVLATNNSVNMLA